MVPLLAGSAKELCRGVLPPTRRADAGEAHTVTSTKVVCALGVALAAVERKRKAADLEARVLTMSRVMAVHDSLHHVDAAPRLGGCSLPVVGFIGVIAQRVR